MTQTATTTRSYCPECNEEFDPEVEVCPHDGARLYSYRIQKSASDELIGTTLDGRFRLVSVLGEGGMGKVYLGKQLSVDRDVAVKVLRSELLDEEMVIKRFFREARVISNFSHHSIVNLIDFGQDDEHNLLYLVMERIQGVDVASLVQRGRFQLELACEIARQVCNALAEPHAQGVIHRDLKPENIMLVAGADGSVQTKVLDFGIAQALQTDTRITKTGMICGTAQYMPPEQARARDIDAGTDIYALGCILFEFLTGRLPFEGSNLTEILLKHIQLEAPSLRDYLPASEVPDDLVALVADMLEKDPADRPPDVLTVRDRLEAVQRTHDLPPVRIDPSAPDDEMYERWLLPRAEARAATISDRHAAHTGSLTRQSAHTDDLTDPVAPTAAASPSYEELAAVSDDADSPGTGTNSPGTGAGSIRPESADSPAAPTAAVAQAPGRVDTEHVELEGSLGMHSEPSAAVAAEQPVPEGRTRRLLLALMLVIAILFTAVAFFAYDRLADVEPDREVEGAVAAEEPGTEEPGTEEPESPRAATESDNNAAVAPGAAASTSADTRDVAATATDATTAGLADSAGGTTTDAAGEPESPGEDASERDAAAAQKKRATRRKETSSKKRVSKWRASKERASKKLDESEKSPSSETDDKKEPPAKTEEKPFLAPPDSSDDDVNFFPVE